MKWRKWNRILHRDLGYFFVGMIIIYAVSGIALNHKKDFNPNYTISRHEFISKKSVLTPSSTVQFIHDFLKKVDTTIQYKSHYFPRKTLLKVFLKGGGTVEFDTQSRKGVIEKISKIPILFEFNFLHYNPGRLWTWFSDIFCLSLLFLAIGGLFIIKGKKGITGRGLWLTAAGVIIPILFLIL